MLHLTRGLTVVAVAAGCWTGSGTPPLREKSSEPKVDMACVIRGEQGTLLTSVPDRVAGFTVTTTATGVHLHRDGRVLTDSEAAALWQSLQTGWFARGGLAMGSTGLSSVDRCEDVGPGGCFRIAVWICQRSLDDIAASFAEILAARGAADVAASIDIHYLETRGPRCKQGRDCAPVTQYSRRETYDPSRPRVDMHQGAGACRDDGDCNASQTCQAWYLGGGFETLEYRQYKEPTFCGCIGHRCTWFKQP